LATLVAGVDLATAATLVSDEAEAEALVTLEAEAAGWVAGNCAAFAAGVLATLEPFITLGSPAGCFEAEPAAELAAELAAALEAEGLGFAALDAGLTLSAKFFEAVFISLLSESAGWAVRIMAAKLTRTANSRRET
jgi:hypothetical protein